MDQDELVWSGWPKNVDRFTSYFLHKTTKTFLHKTTKHFFNWKHMTYTYCFTINENLKNMFHQELTLDITTAFVDISTTAQTWTFAICASWNINHRCLWLPCDWGIQVNPPHRRPALKFLRPPAPKFPAFWETLWKRFWYTRRIFNICKP